MVRAHLPGAGGFFTEKRSVKVPGGSDLFTQDVKKLIDILGFPVMHRNSEFDIHQPPAAASDRQLKRQFTVGAVSDRLVFPKGFANTGQEMVCINVFTDLF